MDTDAHPGSGPWLPPPRDPASPYRVALVCLGNICRSPMAEAVLDQRLAAAGLRGRVEVVSAGTGRWHLGEPMDPRAAAALRAHGYDPAGHRAQQFGPGWWQGCDLVLAMDERNLHDLHDPHDPHSEEPAVADDAGRAGLFRDFDPEAAAGDRDVPDPYYDGEDGFEVVLGMIERTVDTLVSTLRRLPASEQG